MSSVTRAQKYRPIDLRLADRARAAIAHRSEHVVVAHDDTAASADGTRSYRVNSRLLRPWPGRNVSLSRSYRDGDVELNGLVRVPEWAVDATNVMELIEATRANATIGPVVDAHAVRSHYPIGATLDLDGTEILADGFHRPPPAGRGPSARDGNFLDSATRLLRRSGQLSDAQVVEGSADEVTFLAPQPPPKPRVRVQRLADDNRPGTIADYTFTDGEAAVLVEPDYAPLRTHDSLDGSDLAPGETVDLVVGSADGAQLKLIRSDGRGWFLVRMNSNRPVFQTLDRHDRDFLSKLEPDTPIRGMVVPDTHHGNTVSLLPDLLARVDALPAATGKPRDGRPQRLLPARLTSDEPNKNGFVRLELDGTDHLVSFSIRTDRLEEWRVPLRANQRLLIALRPDLNEQRDRDTKKVKDFRVSRPVPDQADVSIIETAGYRVISDADGRRITNPTGIRPDPDLWAEVARSYRSIGPLFCQFSVNSLAQGVSYSRTPRRNEAFDAPQGSWSPPALPSWLGTRLQPAGEVTADAICGVDHDRGIAPIASLVAQPDSGPEFVREWTAADHSDSPTSMRADSAIETDRTPGAEASHVVAARDSANRANREPPQFLCASCGTSFRTMSDRSNHYTANRGRTTCSATSLGSPTRRADTPSREPERARPTTSAPTKPHAPADNKTPSPDHNPTPRPRRARRSIRRRVALIVAIALTTLIVAGGLAASSVPTPPNSSVLDRIDLARAALWAQVRFREPFDSGLRVDGAKDLVSLDPGLQNAGRAAAVFLSSHGRRTERLWFATVLLNQDEGDTKGLIALMRAEREADDTDRQLLDQAIRTAFQRSQAWPAPTSSQQALLTEAALASAETQGAELLLVAASTAPRLDEKQRVQLATALAGTNPRTVLGELEAYNLSIQVAPTALALKQKANLLPDGDEKLLLLAAAHNLETSGTGDP